MRLILLVFIYFFAKTSWGLSPCPTKCPNHNSSYVLDYYWRDYFGTVPYDAFPGGLDEEDQITYIGQVYLKEYELLPGTLYRGCPIILTSAYDITEIKSNKFIKILCSNLPYKLKWKATRQGEVNTLTGCHLVIGGAEVGVTVYIGRTRFNGQTIIGKVFYGEGIDSALAIPGTNQRFTNFEILTYNC
ncbi:hypothetical protein FQR65_LT10711 [Abscondita terminalis]|nr:hypothetical protein FQR65_LT10711 [Abscondita terminalis]